MNRLPATWRSFAYRGMIFYSMRTEPRDRFGTHVEPRSAREAIRTLIVNTGMADIHFSDRSPHRSAAGYKS